MENFKGKKGTKTRQLAALLIWNQLQEPLQVMRNFKMITLLQFSSHGQKKYHMEKKYSMKKLLFH